MCITYETWNCMKWSDVIRKLYDWLKINSRLYYVNIREYVHMHRSICPLNYLSSICPLFVYLFVYLLYLFDSCDSSLSPRQSSSANCHSPAPGLPWGPHWAIAPSPNTALHLSWRHGIAASRLSQRHGSRLASSKFPTAESHHTQLIVLGGFHKLRDKEAGGRT